MSDEKNFHNQDDVINRYRENHPTKVTGARIDPIEFVDEATKEEEAVSINDLTKALQFGCPKLLKQLEVTYKKGGLKALGAISKLLDYWMAIKGAVDGNIAVNEASIVFNITVDGEDVDK